MKTVRDIALEMRRAALEAGEKTLQFFQNEDLAVEAKSDDSPVTAADRAADDVIVARLETAFPDIPVVTEERADSHEVLQRQGVERFFLVDPLDGTKEFVSGSGEYTVNIALIEHGRPVLGVVFAPAKNRLFWTPETDFAVEEQGEIQIDVVEPTRRLWVSQADNGALRIVASKSHRDAATDAFIAELSVGRLESAGSSLKFCLIAGGEADVYPRMGRTMAWDTAAAHAVLRAAGGRVRRLDAEGRVGEALRYGGSEDFSNTAFVAYTPSARLPGVSEETHEASQSATPDEALDDNHAAPTAAQA